ncbi:MAG: ribosomal protein S18-alanine N-acetyltransferase [Gammaproteobacteria bacterium]|nr:ribosomal protein S18-alanine N-acetyltransferase [Gammaproteobacteria bacterium]MCP5199339.1 ribosomal protein S18-alanine N-acetyltransferase [Gammaproteobacteria bacterium]
MDEADIPAVLEVEHACYDFPWSGNIFSDCLRVGYCCWVLDDGETLCGHGIMSVAVEESHILNICVAPAARRQGHARTLMRHLLETAGTHGARIAYLEVRPSNDAAIRLYQELGFRHVGTRRDYYPAHDGREDAFVLSMPLGPPLDHRGAS